MKKVAVLLVMTLTLFSCSKEDLVNSNCNCGLIVSDDATDYSVTIRSQCSGVEKRWTLTPGDWQNAFVGSDYCIYNSTGW
tara:strand:+ start:59 stop:298 length:240 start_codon:yes stop_codon:yes gene_type:complete